ncbi:MAG: hypothetical protein NC349_05595 [Paenibacillus sp.]|nr:hypothetical protein [Paenibacillus sp.]
MADNYLEKRMEEYRSGRLASTSRSTPSMRSPRKNNQLSLSYDPMVVVIIGITPGEELAETIMAFTSVGCRVAFTSGNPKASTALAQRSGARYYPEGYAWDAMLADITSRWGEPAIFIAFTSDADDGTSVAVSCRSLPPSTRIINASALTGRAPARVIARHLLYLAHPSNAFLLDS